MGEGTAEPGVRGCFLGAKSANRSPSCIFRRQTKRTNPRGTASRTRTSISIGGTLYEEKQGLEGNRGRRVRTGGGRHSPGCPGAAATRSTGWLEERHGGEEFRPKNLRWRYGVQRQACDGSSVLGPGHHGDGPDVGRRQSHSSPE